MISPPIKTIQIHKGQRIAQLLLLPYHTAIGHTVTQSERQERGFTSSDMVFWVTEITQKCPMKTILVTGKSIVGLLDTGADVSCISGKDWPRSWPTHMTENDLVGIGRVTAVTPSVYGIRFYHVCAPPTFPLQFILCLRTWITFFFFFNELQHSPVNGCSTAS